MRRALAVAVVSAIALYAALRAEPAPPRAHEVAIDVIPFDARGRVIEDLKPAEFELKEDGVIQAVETARLLRVRPAGTAVALPVATKPTVDEQQAASRDDARLLAIFLDEYHVSPGESTARARAALSHFVDSSVAPHDVVIVFKPLDSLLEIHASDLEAVRRSIDGFEGRKGDYSPRNQYERDFFAGNPTRIDVARNQVTLSALNALAVHLGSLNDRRKALFVLSEGLGGSARVRGGGPLATIDTIHRSADRANVSLYTIDPRPVVDDGDGDLLRRIAGQTNGQAIGGDLDSGLRRAASDSNTYYLLGYHSAHKEDGRFHEIQVHVKRNGASVRARDGYWAPSPDEIMRAEMIESAKHPKPAAPLEPAQHVSAIIKPWFGESRGAEGKTRVTFVWEPTPRVPGDRSRQPTPSKIMLTAKTNDGTVVFEGPVSPTGPALVDDPGLTPARAVFDMPPGRLRLRMAIEDVTDKVIDQDVRDLSVRDLRGAVSVGSPEILRARTVREFRALNAEDAVPSAAREFSRTEHLLVRFRAYGADATPPAVSAKLLVGSGAVVRDLPVAAPTAADGKYVVDLPLAWLAQGEYTLQIAATIGTAEARDRVTFRVTP